jgi:hypothetical protein
MFVLQINKLCPTSEQSEMQEASLVLLWLIWNKRPAECELNRAVINRSELKAEWLVLL